MRIIALLLAGCVTQDWPAWRGAKGDAKLDGFKPPATWPKELQRGWQVEVGEGHSTPALVEGKLYVFARQGGDEVTLSLDAASGKELWRDKLAVDAEFMLQSASKPHGKGPFSSPSVAGGRVFTFGIRGTLTCLDAKEGKVLWRHDFKDRLGTPYPQWGAAASPLVLDGACVIHVGGDKKGSIVSLDVATGKQKWSWDGDGPGYATSILATVGGKPQLITQTQYKAVGLSPADGKLLWELEYKTNYDQNSVTPVVLGDLVILSGTARGVTAYRIGGGKPEQAWHTDDVAMYMSSPLLKGDRLYGFSEKRKGQFFCLDAKTGQAFWTAGSRLGENAALLDAGEVILALATPRPDGNDPSHLIVFDAHEKAYAQRPPIKVADTPAWAHPVVSGRSIYIKDKTKLTLWTIP